MGNSVFKSNIKKEDVKKVFKNSSLLCLKAEYNQFLNL